MGGNGSRRIVADCRWTGYTGIGRVTDLFLRGGAASQPHGDWLLWGPATVGERRWPAAEYRASTGSPLALLGQAATGRVPRGGSRLFLHVVRPLVVPRPSVVLTHDVIPVLHDPSPLRRQVWRSFFRASLRSADRVVVYSEATASRLADLGVEARRIRRITMTIDADLALRARARRREAHLGAPFLLYVGQTKPHKNLKRAVAGFSRSDFMRQGGRFVLLGATPAAKAELDSLAASTGVTGVEVRLRCSDDELEQLYASAAAVILPSLEEGFGLPVLEAQVAGIPVCCSDIPAHREAAAGGKAVWFDPRSRAAISDAIDRVVDLRPGPSPQLLRPAEFTAQFAAVMRELT